MKNFLFCLFFFPAFMHFYCAEAVADSSLRIVLDPGHGGSDLGATRDSFIESKIVLTIAQKLKKFLEEKPGFQVYLTRENDQGISLKERVKIANKIGADLFISLHANTSTSSSLSGMEYYFNSPARVPAAQNNDPPPALTNNEVLATIKEDFNRYDKTEKSLRLSKSIQSLNLRRSESEKSVIKRAPFFVIENTGMPSVLVELGFISNRREAKKLVTPEYQNELVRLIGTAIVDYKEKSDKGLAL